jgi:hypothetical protein
MNVAPTGHPLPKSPQYQLSPPYLGGREPNADEVRSVAATSSSICAARNLSSLVTGVCGFDGSFTFTVGNDGV